jgi:hypothetical protein
LEALGGDVQFIGVAGQLKDLVLFAWIGDRERYEPENRF